jgi:hypothetical protein
VRSVTVKKPQSTRLAKALYWLGGKLSYIKWPTKTYSLDFATDHTDQFLTQYVGRAWLPNRLSMKMLEWSLDCDVKHWDHWALVHDHCNGARCDACGGFVCEPGDEEIEDVLA